MTSRQCHYSLHLNQIYSAHNLKYYLSYAHSVLHYLCQARHSEVPLSAFQNYKMFRLLMTSLERHDRLITIQTLPKAHPKRLSFIFRVYCGLNIFRSASIYLPQYRYQDCRMFPLFMTSPQRHCKLILIQTLPKAHPK